GFQSRIDEKWSVGASITDWGSIHWKNILTSESRKTIRYDGARLTNLLNAEQILLIGLIDSLESLFDLQERTGQIRTKLPIQWRSNVKYQLNEKFSLFTSLYYVPVQFDPVTVAVGVSHFIGSYLMLGVSGSNRHKTLNLGFNVAVRLQKWMGFISADQVLKGLNPTKSNRYSLRAGINLHLNGTDALFN
ncbi:MAG: DUF5723 family protein, partial [Saprospiraceae bacterium]|nr:DUF5723 family protein [Saprospiraceae bacterium]